MSYKLRATSYKFAFVLSCFLLFSLCRCDKEEIIVGSWRLQNVLMNEEPFNDSLQFNLTPEFTYYTFNYANSLTVKTYALDQYTLSSNGYYRLVNKSTLEMRFSLLYRHYNINAKIKKLTQRELNLEYEDNENTYFLTLYKY